MSNKKNKIILFHAHWCGACRNFMPIWKKVTNDYKNKIDVLEIEHSNFDNVKYETRDIQGFPTTRVYDHKGKKITEIVGGRDEATFRKFLNKFTKVKKSKTRRRRRKKTRGKPRRRPRRRPRRKSRRRPKRNM